MTNRNGKRGRPNQPTYATSWDETVEGVYLGKDRKLRIHGRSRPAFAIGSTMQSERRAVMKIKRALAELHGEDDQCKHWTKVAAMSDAERQKWYSDGRIQQDKEGWFDDQFSYAIKEERQRIIELILSNPKQAALELGIPHLADYPAAPTKPQWTLQGIHDFYIKNARNKRGKPLDPKKHVPNSKRWWTEFMQIVGVKHYRDLTVEHIERYHAEIMGRFDRDEYAPDTVRNRFAKIKRVFQFGLERARTDAEKAEMRRLLDLCMILKAPASEDDPMPMPPETFRKLLAVARPREKAMMLLGANCLMHSGEVSATMKKDVDLAEGTIRQRRTKNGHPRAAKLWDRTVAAILEYQRVKLHQSPYLFVTRNGTPADMRQLFLTIRRRAGVSEQVTFEGVRDAGFTVGEEIDLKRVKFVAGHKAGMSDKYVYRQATNKKVIAVCEGVERFFFGDEK